MPTTSPPMVHDYCEIFPDLARLRDRATQGDLRGALGAMDRAGLAGVVEVDRRLWVLAGEAGVDEPLERLLAAEPGHRRGRTLRALRLLVRGWDIRGTATAEHVTTAQFDAFHDHLRRAEQVLLRLCAEDPADPEPWALRLVTARGLSLGIPETRRRYTRLVELDRHHVEAHQHLVQSLCPKWGGSWDALFEFARDCADAAPDGSAQVGVLTTAHLERWAGEDDPELRDGYLSDPDVVADLEEVSDRLLAGEATPYSWVGAHSDVAVALVLAGRPQRAVRHLGVLGPAMEDRAWALAGPRRDEVEELRAQAATHGAYR
ncbi:hypothetical protein [Phycicoccus flavus]|uniref:hypothetical protein n=1 Tax=Phycicoccus flavus TaxID=2502783 RepID=UPI000FEBEE37|nr:hypothetical protein [Phycicoccus flavus]NHA69183.1 hypothetical protein [Phycicoccus flavus]